MCSHWPNWYVYQGLQIWRTRGSQHTHDKGGGRVREGACTYWSTLSTYLPRDLSSTGPILTRYFEVGGLRVNSGIISRDGFRWNSSICETIYLGSLCSDTRLCVYRKCKGSYIVLNVCQGEILYIFSWSTLRCQVWNIKVGDDWVLKPAFYWCLDKGGDDFLITANFQSRLWRLLRRI